MSNRFYKTRKNRLVAGVVAGLADKFGWDLALARILAIILMVSTQFGIFLYLVLAFLLPYKEDIYPEIKLKDGHLDFNPKLYEEHGLETFRKIVRHELCHYHLYFQGKGYKHVDRDFKDLLAKVEGLRYAPKMQGQKEKYYLYQCQSCGHIYRRKRRVNTQKFGCGLCRGKLIFLNQS